MIQKKSLIDNEFEIIIKTCHNIKFIIRELSSNPHGWGNNESQLYKETKGSSCNCIGVNLVFLLFFWVDWLNLTACQHDKGYFMPRGWRIVFLIIFLCSYFFKFFFFAHSSIKYKWFLNRFTLVWFDFNGISIIEGYSMPNPILSYKQFYFKQSNLVKGKWFQVLLCITNNSIKNQSFVYSQSNVKTVLFQTTQFGISKQFSSIWLIDRTLSGATTLGKSGPGSDGNKGVLCILKVPVLLETHHQIVLFHIQDTHYGSFTPLQRCSQCILQPHPTGPLNKFDLGRGS